MPATPATTARKQRRPRSNRTSRPPEPGRREPNGFCVDCGIKIRRKDALRCRQHANLYNNRQKAGSFTPYSARKAVVVKTERARAEHEELLRLRERLGLDPLTGEQVTEAQPAPA